MAAQILIVLRRPTFALSSVAIALVFSLIFLYFDEFYFVSPYLVAYVDPGRLPFLALDIVISALSGIVITLSVFEVRSLSDRTNPYRKTGVAGIIAAFVAGACPCYYLVPILAVSGGVGGVLGALGILFFDYQIPIKLSSLALLVFTTFTVERGLRAACAAPVPPAN